MLADLLSQNSIVKQKIPDLLIKGYYGPVTPSPEGKDASLMTPGRERPSKEEVLPTRFYKGTRLRIFKPDSGASVAEHQPRGSPTNKTP